MAGSPPGTLGNPNPSTLLLASPFCHAFLFWSTRIANTLRCSTTCLGTATATGAAGGGGGGNSLSLAEVAAEKAAEPAVVAADKAEETHPLEEEEGEEGDGEGLDLAACLAL